MNRIHLLILIVIGVLLAICLLTFALPPSSSALSTDFWRQHLLAEGYELNRTLYPEGYDGMAWHYHKKRQDGSYLLCSVGHVTDKEQRVESIFCHVASATDMEPEEVDTAVEEMLAVVEPALPGLLQAVTDAESRMEEVNVEKAKAVAPRTDKQAAVKLGAIRLKIRRYGTSDEQPEIELRDKRRFMFSLDVHFPEKD